MASLPTPDSIGALPRSRTELVPAAKSVAAYQGSTRIDIADPVHTNGLTQLAGALQHIQPTLQQAAGVYKEYKDSVDTSEGAVAASKAAQDKNVKDINDLVHRGYLREGASPTSMLAAQTNLLKLRGEQSQMRAREDYYNNPKVRTGEMPYEQWAAQWSADNEKATLLKEDGTPRFSDLELAKSGFHERVADGLRGIQSEHIAHRVSENEAAARANAGNLATSRLEIQLGTDLSLIPNEHRDYATLGKIVKDAYYGPTGYVTLGGGDKTKAASDMADAIVDKAVAEKDTDLLRIAEHIDTPGGSLAGTKDFKEKARKAIDHIAGAKYQAETRELAIALQRSHGPIAEQAKVEAEKYQRTQNAEVKKNAIDALEGAVYGYDPQHITPGQAQERAGYMATLKAISPEAAIKLDLAVAKIDEQKFDNAHRRSFSVEEAKLQNVVAKSPGTPATHATLLQALREDKIDGAGYRRLRAESDQAGSDERDPRIKKILSSRDYAMLEEKVISGTAKDLSKISGQESIAGGLAGYQFRSKARAYLKKNPNWDSADLADAMVPHVEPIVAQYNDVVQTELQAAKEAKDAQEQFLKELADARDKMQERLEPEVKKLRSEPAPAENKAAITAKPAEKASAPPKDFNTVLGAKNEETFQKWKAKWAPLDSGADYDLRGAFKAGLKPDAKTGHWPDTFKKPNHPTFSDQSQYAKFGKPGRWEGETFFPNGK